MATRSRSLRIAALAALVLWTPDRLDAQQPRVTDPREEFGFNFGDDYRLATYKQLEAYWVKLSRQSDRMILDTIGVTSEGRQQLMAIVSSPANLRNLERYKEISRRLALAEGLTDDQARALAKEGKTIAWIDGGLHASEVLGAQQLGEMVYQMVSRTDEESMRFLNDVVILFVHANPDGNDLVAGWYMRNAVPEQRSPANLPLLYHKYIGHDNNRDFFGSTQKESENMNRVLYREWYPQLLYNHHQSGPPGTVLWAPPLRDPFNFNQDPLIPLGIQTMSMALHTRLAAEGKPGATMRSGGSYDGWWNGGLRNTAAFHNTIAILTEMIGSPTPTTIPLVASRLLPNSDYPYPVMPQVWHFRQSIEYSITCNRAILDFASRERENILFNRYRMGKNSIERGSTDTWTPWPKRIAALAAQSGGAAGGRGGGGGGRGGGGGGGGAASSGEATLAAFRTPESRDPRGYIIPSNQPDFPTAARFINALLETGITVSRATREFTVNGKTYPANSYVVKTDQAFRPHVMDMFEPQDHPDVIPYPGATPTPPYDNAGWTLALQMGIEFDRVLDGFTGPFEPIPDWNVKPPAGAVATVPRTVGYFTSHAANDAFIALNRLFKANEEAYWLTAPVAANGKTYPAGTLYIASKPTTLRALQGIALDLGVSFEATAARPTGDALKLKAPRVGLWDQYGGSIEAGWTRWILEQFEFPFNLTFAPELNAGSLNAKYDVLIFVGGIPGGGGGGRAAGGGGGGGRGGAAGGGGGGGGAQTVPETIPAEYRNMWGSLNAGTTVPILKQFIENGGTIIALGGAATNLAAHLELPITDHLVENGAPLQRNKFFVPGSVLNLKVDNTHPLAHGMKERVNTFYDNSPAWDLGADAAAKGVTRIAWFDSKTPVVSGWGFGQQYLDGATAAVEAKIGRGKAFLFAPEILQRAQPHGTFKFLFNGIYYGSATPARIQ